MPLMKVQVQCKHNASHLPHAVAGVPPIQVDILEDEGTADILNAVQEVYGMRTAFQMHSKEPTVCAGYAGVAQEDPLKATSFTCALGDLMDLDEKCRAQSRIANLVKSGQSCTC